MVITKMALPRRTFLRGMGATLALPFLDAMVPVGLRGLSAEPVHRFQTFYVPNGMAMEYWSPMTSGADFALTPILEPLAAFRDQMLVLSGIRANWNQIHAGASGSFLTGIPQGGRTETEIFADVSMDQVLARKFGRITQLASLELSMDASANAGACSSNLSCVYTHTLSWRGPTQPLPMEYNPRAVFERLFGEGGSLAERRAALKSRASLLDSFNDDIARLKGSVGTADRARVDQYLDSIREVERQIQRAEAAASDNLLPDLDRPVGVPQSFGDHAKLMFDLQALAFQADITRVVTFQLTRELSNRTYPEIGVPDPHHPTSHHGGDPEKLAKIAKINTFHVSLFAEFLQKLQATPEGDGTLLDNTVYLYGSGMGNSSLHDHVNLPILVAGGAATGMRGGRHIRYENGTSLGNLHLTLLDRVGVHLDTFGDSDGKVEDLFHPVAL